MKIAILGGSFDPPHNGHLAIATRLLKLDFFDQIWLMPCYQHPFSKNISSPKKRLAMTKYFESNSIKVSDYEIENKTTSYTVDTLKYFDNKFPHDKFSWIIGTDQVGSFTKWKNWQTIIDKFKLVVVPRTDYKKAKKEIRDIAKQVAHPENIALIDRQIFPSIYVSSRLIRQKIKDGQPISGLVPKKVEKYIILNKLYK